MRLFLYYALHSFKNQVKKLFRTWVAILIGVIIVISLLSGLFFSLIDRMEEGGEEPEPSTDIPAETDPPEPEIERWAQRGRKSRNEYKSISPLNCETYKSGSNESWF